MMRQRCQDIVDRTVQAHGLPDGLVHLVTASSAGKRLEQLSADEFQRTFDLALTPSFVLCRELAERMKSRGSGSIVLFSSMYGMVSPDPRIYHHPMAPNPIDYGASKAATLQLSRYLAVHYGPHGIRFNCVTPGPFPNPAVQKIIRISSTTSPKRPPSIASVKIARSSGLPSSC